MSDAERRTGSERPDLERDELEKHQAIEDGTDAWRGVAAEGAENVSAQGTVFLKRRSRGLLWDLLKPYKTIVWFLLVAILLENAARLAIPALVRHGIDEGVPPLQAGESGNVLITTIVTMALALALQAGCRMWFLSQSGRIGQEVLLELRRRVFKHFHKLDVSFHEKYTSGRMVSRLTSDVEAIQEMLATGFDRLVAAVLTLGGVAVILLVMDLHLGLVCLLSFPILMLLVRWFSKASTIVYRRVRETSAVVIVQFVETMVGIRAVQAYRREPRNQEIFEDVAGDFRDANVTSMRLNAIFMPSVKLVGNLTIGVVILYGCLRVLEGDMTIGTLVAFMLYLRTFFEPMQEISQFYNLFLSASSGLEKLSGVLEEGPEVKEPVDAAPTPRASGDVQLDHVHFEYVEGHPILPDLDLHLPAGQTVALVGTTGAGKTTIAKLVSRFYDPTAGAVRLDGVDLRDMTNDDLRRDVVMVTQENVIFEGSLAENIRFGKPSATHEEIVAAGEAVGLGEFVASLPDGWHTDTGKRGSRLSAGQRQLVAFARAFLADPAVLILDEATSSLDIPSERLVQKALATVLAGRTAIIIAHRLSTVDIADRVLVLEHGQVIEDGSPAELVAREDGRYAALHNAWEESLR